MKVMMFILETPEHFASRADGPAADAYWTAWQSYSAAVNDKVVGGNVLPSGSDAVTLRRRDGERVIQDGPFVDSKESLGGYMIFEVDTMDEAIELASTCPCLDGGAVELRPIVPMSDMT